MCEDVCEHCFNDSDEQILSECSECQAITCLDCLEFGKCPDCKEDDLCECCGCSVADGLIECEECCAWVGSCCWNQLEGKCQYCVHEEE